MASITIRDTQEKCEKNPCLVGCAGFGVFMLVLFLSTCWGMVQPTEFGLRRNGITGQVDLNTVYEGGRHFLGWGSEFIVFPRRYQTIAPVVQARTGPGENDNSGGQPVTLEVSFQYQLVKEKVPQQRTTRRHTLAPRLSPDLSKLRPTSLPPLTIPGPPTT
jgi:hypothetical protein